MRLCVVRAHTDDDNVRFEWEWFFCCAGCVLCDDDSIRARGARDRTRECSRLYAVHNWQLHARVQTIDKIPHRYSGRARTSLAEDSAPNHDRESGHTLCALEQRLSPARHRVVAVDN